MDELNQPTPIQSNIPPSPSNIPPTPQTNIVPPPPTTPQVQVRTMESDTQSMRASGGAEPVPQFVPPPPVTISQPQPIPLSNNPAPAPMPEVQEVKSGGSIFWLSILIIIIGIGWLAYQYGLPAYRAMTATEMATEPITDTTAPQPEADGLTTAPLSQAVTPTTTPLGGTIAALVKIETDGTAASITAALAAEAKKGGVPSGTIKEVSITNNGTPMSFGTVMNALLPEAQTNGLAGILTAGFDPNFSAYIFYDDRGAWPGYVAKIDPAAQIDPTTLISRLQAIETSSYQNLFLTDSGTASGFKTGQARGKYIDRFAPLTADGALFSYGIFGDYFIVNTSNNGLVKALDLLKL